jgi:hypothetical protein
MVLIFQEIGLFQQFRAFFAEVSKMEGQGLELQQLKK